MQLVYAFLADAADVGQTGKISVVGGDFETIYVPQVPTVQPQIAVVMQLLVEPQECERPHTLDLLIKDPGDAPFALAPTSAFTPHLVPGREGQPVRFHLVMTLPLVPLTMAGEYSIRVIVDGVELSAVMFRVETGPMRLPDMASQRDAR